jgi:hypothetical protein
MICKLLRRKDFFENGRTFEGLEVLATTDSCIVAVARFSWN